MLALYTVESFGNLGAQVTAIIDGKAVPVGMMSNVNTARNYVEESLRERGIAAQWSTGTVLGATVDHTQQFTI